MGKKSTPAAPPAPDPYATAQAQTQSNLLTAQANSIIGNADETTPWGTVRYTQLPSVRVGGQGGAGAGAGGGYGLYNGMPNIFGRSGGTTDAGGYDVPRFERTVTLSPTEQRKFEQQQQLGIDLNELALGQTRRVGDVLGQPINAEGLPERVTSLGALPELQGFNLARTSDVGDIQRQLGPTDFSADRQRVEDALYARLNPQLEQERTSLETNLVNQGFQRGTEAFNEAMNQYGRQANDARMGVIRAGGDEQSRLFQLALAQGQFANTAQQQAYDQMIGAAGFNNAAQQAEIEQANQNRLGLYGLGAQAADFQNQQRQAALQERLALRNQPLNEVSALMSGGQVSMPNFPQYQAGQVAGTPVGDYVYRSADLQNQQYQAALNRQAQERAALYGGIGSIAGMGLYGLGSGGFFKPR